jgi:hypothetical protein
MQTEDQIRLSTILKEVQTFIPRDIYEVCFSWCVNNGLTADDLMNLFMGCGCSYQMLANVFDYLYECLHAGRYPYRITGTGRRFTAIGILNRCTAHIESVNTRQIVSNKSTEQLAQELLDIL